MTTRKKNSIKLLVLLFVVLQCISACGLKIQPKSHAQPVVPGNIPRKIESVNQVQVTFTVETPPTEFENVEMALDILDDLSAYQDNILRYPMQNVGENRYEASVLLDEGFDVRYRYVMINPAEVFEKDIFGQPVDLRLAIAKKELRISDTIFNWSIEPASRPFGTLSGILKDEKTQAGIPDMMVSIAGMHTFTDMTGSFRFEKMPEGTHHLVAYATDGAYPSLQQSTVVVAQQVTKIHLSFSPLEKVLVKFEVKPAAETVGVPIRMYGNFVGLGAHYGKGFSSMGSIASLMPLLTQDSPERYTLELELYAGSAFRYRYSMGNGYTNAERSDNGLLVTRKFIVPKTTASKKDEISNWRANQNPPVSIIVDAPINMPANEVVSIQIYHKGWNQPIPMWHVTNNKWMFLLYDSAQEETTQIRFCRNDRCDLSYDPETMNMPVEVRFGGQEELHFQVNRWENWDEKGVSMVAATETTNVEDSMVGMELIKDFSVQNLAYVETNLELLKESGFNWLILRPSWEVSLTDGLPTLAPSSNFFFLNHDLAGLVKSAKDLGMKVSVYPGLVFPMKASIWWETTERDEAWWQRWYQEYAHFLDNFATFSEAYQIDHLIIGENALRFTYPNGLNAQDEKPGTPADANETWQTMLANVKNIYTGAILWATPLDSLISDSFVDNVDGFYVLINYSEESKDLQSLTQTIETRLLPFHDKNQKTIYVALNIPSLSAEAMEYTDHMEPIISSPNNVDDNLTDLDIQTNLYKAFTCKLQPLDWISGISTRGFNPSVQLTDFSSTIYGKPAMVEFLNCMNNSQ